MRTTRRQFAVEPLESKQLLSTIDGHPGFHDALPATVVPVGHFQVTSVPHLRVHPGPISKNAVSDPDGPITGTLTGKYTETDPDGPIEVSASGKLSSVGQVTMSGMVNPGQGVVVRSRTRIRGSVGTSAVAELNLANPGGTLTVSGYGPYVDIYTNALAADASAGTGLYTNQHASGWLKFTGPGLGTSPLRSSTGTILVKFDLDRASS